MDKDTRENTLEFMAGDNRMTVMFSQKKFITKILTLAKNNPDIEIVAYPESNGGYLLAHIPVSYLKLRKPMDLSEDRKHRLSELLKKVRNTTTKETD